MADFGSTKYNVSFEEWHELLMDYAELRGGSAADAEAWRDDYEAGKTPVEQEHGRMLLTGCSERPAALPFWVKLTIHQHPAIRLAN
ncbi:TPA: hypothetical protein IHN84_001074 [Escherichia coli]|nr:hypothetical protein [Escherichia coli]